MLQDVTRRRVPGGEPGVEIALLDWGGEGPLILLHHANGFCGALWAEVAAELRHRYRVVALDARGHGDSSKPEAPAAYAWQRVADDAAAVAGALAAEHPDGRVALGVGHSFGGIALLTAAAGRPGLFARLLLVDPVVHPPGWRRLLPPGESPAERLARAARRRRHVWRSRAAARRHWARREFFRAWTPTALDLYAGEGLRARPDGQVELKCPGEVEAMIFERGGALDALPLAEKVTAPTLLLWAARDSFPRSAYESLAGRLPAGRLEDADAGHLIPMERPELVVGAVERFCEGAQASIG